MSKYPRKVMRGFTLIEMLLYVAISSIFLVSLSVFLAEIFRVSVKSQAISEVNQQGTQAIEVIAQTIRNAKGITTPTSGTSSQISITVKNASSSPTVYDLATGTLRIKEGVGSYIPITSQNVIVSSLVFRNMSASSTDGGSIDVSFTVSYATSSSDVQYAFSRTFSKSAPFH